MTVWVIITACLINGVSRGRDYETRKIEYTNCIPKIIEKFRGCNIVIVENNSYLKRGLKFGIHRTFLDNFGVPVFYTTTNETPRRNYGINELLDIWKTIQRFNIQDDDFVVKITGRYMLKDDSDFVNQVKKLDHTKYDAIIRYGSYTYDPPETKVKNCVSGLIGLRCKYVRQLEIPDEDTFVEEKWAEKIMSLDDSKVCSLKWLGIYIRPEHKEKHFLV